MRGTPARALGRDVDLGKHAGAQALAVGADHFEGAHGDANRATGRVHDGGERGDFGGKCGRAKRLAGDGGGHLKAQLS